jgi:putative ABC transport system ATP-binding protein
MLLPPLIQLTNLRKEYKTSKNSVIALNNINLTIDSGEFVSIMGPSGSGKSTLLNILGLLDIFDSGMYILNQQQTRILTDRELAGIRNTQIGFVFQAFNLLPQRNALENVSLPLYYRGIPFKERNERAMCLLEKMGLADWAHHLPDELSGGQKQRVAIARALCADPQIILADEPTGALDTQTSTEIVDLLEKINETGKTIVVVTHEHEIAVRTKRMVLLVDGKIVDDTLLTQINKNDEQFVLQESRTF